MSLDAASLVAELKRRRVFRVLVGYGVVTFAVLVMSLEWLELGLEGDGLSIEAHRLRHRHVAR